MSKLFYLDNNQVNSPLNHKGLTWELNFGKDQFPNAGTVNITNLQWVRENYDLLTKHIKDGESGGRGIFEGPTLRIDFAEATRKLTVFNGFLDLTDAKVKDRIMIETKSVSHASVDWLNKVASGFTFEYLASLNSGEKGYISPDLYRFMPYVKDIPDAAFQAAVMSLMIFNVVNTLVKEIEEILDILGDISGTFNSIGGAIKFIIKIAYIIVLIIVLIKLVKDIFKFILSPIKYHAGMYVRDLFERACDYLNMDFDSEIWSQNSLWYNEFIIPEKLYNPVSATDSTILGFLKESKNEQIGYFKGTFANLIDAMKVKYNAKIIVHVPQGGATPSNRGKVILIRKDKNGSQPTLQLPGIYQPEYTYNADELQANIMLEYQTDAQDLNTLQDYQGTIYQVICQPKVYTNRPFVMMENFTQAVIPFSRASRKTDLSVTEKMAKTFLKTFEPIANAIVAAANAVIKVINEVIKIIKKIFSFFGIKLKLDPIPTLSKVALSETITNRIGMMKLSSDNFSRPKILILQEGSAAKYNKIHPDTGYLESARAMWEGFHYVNSFLPSADRPNGNQYIIKTFPKVPLTFDDLLLIMENNRCYAADGSEAVIESLKFNEYSQHAEMKVRFSKLYTTNLEEKYLEPTGQ
jgi:hypothetical protein